MEAGLGLVMGTGWAAGLNLYLATLTLGIAARLGVGGAPEVLGEPWVLAIAAALVAVEFVADKVPWLDSVWDVAHTVIRPAGATALGSLLSDGELTAAATAGGLALLAHGGKAALRLLANLSPEPVSNLMLSVTEDGLSLSTVLLALAAPALAALAVVVMAAATVTLVVWVWRRRRGRTDPAAPAPPAAGGPA